MGQTPHRFEQIGILDALLKAQLNRSKQSVEQRPTFEWQAWIGAINEVERVKGRRGIPTANGEITQSVWNCSAAQFQKEVSHWLCVQAVIVRDDTQ
jgi:hypothetical protein